MLPGELVLDVIKDETGPLTVVSPFVKTRALRRMLDCVTSDTPVSVFTRWIPFEIAMGVTDLDVYDLIAAREGGDVSLLRELHAKAYIRGERALVGSANLTGAGMGWRGFSNLEFLVDIPAEHPRVRSLLEQLRKRARSADESLRRAMEQAAAQFATYEVGEVSVLNVAERYVYQDEGGGEQGSEFSIGNKEQGSRVWLPHTTEPRRLFDVYAKGRSANVLTSTREDAKKDLYFLQVPPDLSLKEFIAYVRSMFSQTSVFVTIDRAIGAGRDPVETMADGLSVDRQLAEDRWTVIVDWLMYFFPERYRTEAPSGSYRIVKSRTVT